MSSKIVKDGTFVVAVSGLSYAFVRRISAVYEGESDKITEIRNLEKAILGVATGQYLLGSGMGQMELQQLRYLDWILTTPMLLKTFHSLAEEYGYKESFLPAFSANIIMITSGYYAEYLTKDPVKKKIAYGIGMASLGVVLYQVSKWDRYLKDQGVETRKLASFFYFGWSLYGLNFLNPDRNLRDAAFNVLDLINKGSYSAHLDEVLSDL